MRVADAIRRSGIAIEVHRDIHHAAAGMITIDDLLLDLAADLADLARPVANEVRFAHRDSPVPATT